jgi:hypothetical protein
MGLRERLYGYRWRENNRQKTLAAIYRAAPIGNLAISELAEPAMQPTEQIHWQSIQATLGKITTPKAVEPVLIEIPEQSPAPVIESVIPATA